MRSEWRRGRKHEKPICYSNAFTFIEALERGAAGKALALIETYEATS